MRCQKCGRATFGPVCAVCDGERPPAVPATTQHAGWVVFDNGCPEYSRYSADPDSDWGVNELSDWYFNYEDDVDEAQRQTFIVWLHALPLGVITQARGRRNNGIVRCTWSATT